MRNYPEHIATKQDVINIIENHPGMHGLLEIDLLRISNEPETVEQVISCDSDPETNEMINVVTETITRQNMTWERMGFTDRSELDIYIAGKSMDVQTL